MSVRNVSAGPGGPAAAAAPVGAVLSVSCYESGDAVNRRGRRRVGARGPALPLSLRDGRASVVTALFDNPIVNVVDTVGRPAWRVSLVCQCMGVYAREPRRSAAVVPAAPGVAP